MMYFRTFFSHQRIHLLINEHGLLLTVNSLRFNISILVVFGYQVCIFMCYLFNVLYVGTYYIVPNCEDVYFVMYQTATFYTGII